MPDDSTEVYERNYLKGMRLLNEQGGYDPYARCEILCRHDLGRGMLIEELYDEEGGPFGPLEIDKARFYTPPSDPRRSARLDGST